MEKNKIALKLKQQDRIRRLFYIIEACRCYFGKSINVALLHLRPVNSTKVNDDIADVAFDFNTDYSKVVDILHNTFGCDPEKTDFFCRQIERLDDFNNFWPYIPFYAISLQLVLDYTNCTITKNKLEFIFSNYPALTNCDRPNFSETRKVIGIFETIFDTVQSRDLPNF